MFSLATQHTINIQLIGNQLINRNVGTNMKLYSIVIALLLSSHQLFAATLAISTTTNSRSYPLSEENAVVASLNKQRYTLSVTDVEGECSANEKQKVKFNKPISLTCNTTTELELNIRFKGDYAFYFSDKDNTLLIKRQTKKSSKTTFNRPIPKVQCQQYAGGEVSIRVANTFVNGDLVRDAYSQQTAEVINGHVSILPSPDSGGLVLLELVTPQADKQPLNWNNANIYFVMVDRFKNGDTTNDHAYGRRSDGKDEVGTFHGGDLKGVTAKLDYIKSLGTDAIWLSPIVEQVHGFVGGGSNGSFPFYAYHGYWTRDFTKIDQNFGRDEDLAKLVEEAHKRGIKVLLDAVVNHSGYSTLADLQFDGVNVLSSSAELPEKWRDWSPRAGQNWHSYHNNIDYNSLNWANWWGKDWVRTGLPNYQQPGTGDITMSLAGLPDFITESNKKVTPPNWLLNNPGTRVVAREDYRVSDYLIEWQSDWVKRFGIDGFRVDTVKHVEGEVWQRLKQQASSKLKQWQQQNNKRGDDFWMMGEVWGHSAYRSPYFDDGFDALINFDLQKKMDKGAACYSQMADTYQSYADTIAEEKDFTPVSYISSHDTELFFSRFNSLQMQRNAANALLLTPGAVQVYYGDEVARNIGPYADDFHQGTRSDMLWELDKEREKLLQHWQKLGQFRQAHPAVGAGRHSEIEQENAYVFSRILNDDKVVIAFIGQ